ncbi:superoxide dismutase family protein [Sphingomonas sp.]|uniref:superoxide dismutase family protein n=1 Tax=Sphingomonas sp. TaxID=28214 RepID=UPI0025EF8E70|nr:superoxide dismutase family protein [Sphingomonas sp.]
MTKSILVIDSTAIKPKVAMTIAIICGTLGIALLGGCMAQMGPGSATKIGARAELRDPQGVSHGSVRIERVGAISRVTVNGVALPPGDHGLHIHAVGSCEGPAFASAGAHWNPDMKMHGRDNPMGAHRGDLPNLQVHTDGTGTVSFDLPGGIATLMDADGASIVVHAAPDDFRTDPSGNSGGRIACGVFTRG